MFLTQRKNGYYYIIYFKDKRRISVSTGTKLKSKAKEFMLSYNINPTVTEIKPPIPLRKFMRQYLGYSETAHTPFTYRDYKCTFKFFERYFGSEFDIRTLNTVKIQEYINHRIRNSSYLQGRKDLITLKSAFNKMKSLGVVDFNPCQEIKRLRRPEKLPLFYSQSESDKLLNTIDQIDIKDLVITALNTGLRQGELVSLTWDEVNLANRTITLSNREHVTKSKRVRSIPINNTVYDVFVRRSFCRNGMFSHFSRNRCNKTFYNTDLKNTSARPSSTTN